MAYNARNTGWSSKIRTKVSPRAAEGYLYEVRFKTLFFWRKSRSRAMQDILDTVRCSFGKYKITKNGKNHHRTHYVIYVGSEADLLLLRMTDRENIVFRAYKLSENA
jgi:hypothetical protein